MTLLSALRHFCSQHGREWYQYYYTVSYGYNSVVQWTTGPTPFELVLSRPANPVTLTQVSAIELWEVHPIKLKQRFHDHLKALLDASRQSLGKLNKRTR